MTHTSIIGAAGKHYPCYAQRKRRPQHRLVRHYGGSLCGVTVRTGDPSIAVDC